MVEHNEDPETRACEYVTTVDVANMAHSDSGACFFYSGACVRSGGARDLSRGTCKSTAAFRKCSQ